MPIPWRISGDRLPVRTMKTQTTLTPSERLSPFTVVGNDELCAWRVADATIWVQTRSPRHARRLAQRADSKPVARGVAGGYLRTFEFTGKTLTWAERLIGRYCGGSDRRDNGDRYRVLGHAVGPC